MIRPVAVIVWALMQANPSLPPKTAQLYATHIRAEAKRLKWDPFTAVAIFKWESGVRAWAVSSDGEDLGLGQIRARYRGACRSDPHPVPVYRWQTIIDDEADGRGTVPREIRRRVLVAGPGPACRKARASLLNPIVNIRATFGALAANRKLCRTKTGKAQLHHTLAGYGGLSRPSRGRWCGQVLRHQRWTDLPVHPGVARIIRFRQLLLSRLSRLRLRSRPRKSTRSQKARPSDGCAPGVWR